MDPTKTIPIYIKNLVQACREDSFITPEGKPQNFIDKIFKPNLETEYANFKTICGRLKDNQGFGALPFDDQLEVLARIKEIYRQVKNLHPNETKDLKESIDSLQKMMAAKLTGQVIKQELEGIFFLNLIEGWQEKNRAKCEHALKKIGTLLNQILNKNPELSGEFQKTWKEIYTKLVEKRDVRLLELNQTNEMINKKIEEKDKKEAKTIEEKNTSELYEERAIQFYGSVSEKFALSLRKFKSNFGQLTFSEQLNKLVELEKEYEGLKHLNAFSIEEQRTLPQKIESMKIDLVKEKLTPIFKNLEEAIKQKDVGKIKYSLEYLQTVCLEISNSPLPQLLNFLWKEWGSLHNEFRSNERDPTIHSLLEGTNHMLESSVRELWDRTV